MLNILVVEDNESLRKLMCVHLKRSGYNALSAGNGVEALDVMDRINVHLLIVDIMMPEMDGIQATGIIRAMKRPDAATVPIIAMTANAYPEDSMRARNYGMNEHLPKPISQQKLIETVLKVLSKN